jgi:hypothetical protein
LIKIGSKPATLGWRREELLGQHRVEKRRSLRQLLGQVRCPGHDLGDQLQQAWVSMEQREELHPSR